VNHDLDDVVPTALRALFAAPDFDRPPGLTPAETHERTYRLLRRVAAAEPPAALLADPARLADLMGWAATRDPALGHAVLLHYCLCLNGIATFSPDPDAALAATEGTVGVLFMTEAGRSNSHGAIRTEAHYDPGTRTFTLRTPDAAAAKFPAAAALPHVPKTALVYARLITADIESVFTFRVPFGGPHGVPGGMRIAPVPESTAFPSDYAAVAFDGTRLPFEAWLSDGAILDPDGRLTDPLGDPDARLRRSMAPGAATWLAIVAANAAFARAAAAVAIRFARVRRTADRLAPGLVLLDYRSHRLALFTALADAYALTAVANAAKRNHATADASGSAGWTPWTAVDPLLPLLKTAATDLAARTVRECRSRCGAPGFVGAPILLAYEAATEAYRTAGGDNRLVRFDTARAMLTAEPPAGRVPETLRSPGDFARLAAVCERRLRTVLADGLVAARASGADEAAAWNAHLDAAEEAAGVRAERIVMERFAEAAADSPARPVLERLAVLHGAAWVRRRAASLVRCRLLTAADLRAVDAAAARACDLLLPDVPDLVGAFGVDEDFLGTFVAAEDHLSAFAKRFGFSDL
jgi:acyl-CoA oxidase